MANYSCNQETAILKKQTKIKLHFSTMAQTENRSVPHGEPPLRPLILRTCDLTNR